MAISEVRFTLEIRSGNAALVDDPGHEVARILREAADRIEALSVVADSEHSARLQDINGNRAGSWCLSLDGDEDEGA